MFELKKNEAEAGMHRRMSGLLSLSLSELEQGIGYSSPKAKRPLLGGMGIFSQWCPN